MPKLNQNQASKQEQRREYVSELCHRALPSDRLLVTKTKQGNKSPRRSGYSRSTPFVKHVRALGTALKDSERRAFVLQALAAGDFKAREIGAKIKDCRSGVRWSAGECLPFIRTCDSRFCPACSRRDAATLRNDLQKAITATTTARNIKWSFITLTLNPNQLRDRSCRTAFDTIRKLLSKLFKREEVRELIDGSFYKIEVTKTNLTWNWHIHICAIHECSRRTINKLIKKVWVQSFSKYGSGIIFQIKKFNTSHKSIMEMCSYLVKAINVDSSEFATVVSVVSSRRLRGATGIVRTALACIRNKEKPTDSPPEPPRNYNPATGELYSMPDGRYSKQDLLARVVNNADLAALYSLKLLQYRVRYGYKPKLQPEVANSSQCVSKGG